jgi:uncharacterized protein YcbK (DUF882 family)
MTREGPSGGGATRRRFGAGLAATAASLVGAACAAAPRPAAAAAGGGTRGLSMRHLGTGEAFEAVYYAGGRHLPGAAEAIARLLRDWRTGEAHPIDPALPDLLWALLRQLGTAGPVHVTCGYRTPATNALLRREGHGVSTTSLHMRGMAVDLLVPGRDTAAVRDAAVSLAGGGVGHYPGRGFVHLDTGPVRRWQG